MVNVHFCRSRSFGGWLIRLFTFSRWNHVGVEIGGRVYDATLAGGVRRHSPVKFASQYDDIQSVDVEIPDAQAAKDFLVSQIGKSYDWTAIVALPFRADWQRRRKWFCSELVAAALVEGGRKSLRIQSARVTPRDLWIALPS